MRRRRRRRKRLDQVEKMVEEYDEDGSGLIEFEEFLVLMAKKVGPDVKDEK